MALPRVYSKYDKKKSAVIYVIVKQRENRAARMIICVRFFPVPIGQEKHNLRKNHKNLPVEGPFPQPSGSIPPTFVPA